MQLLPPLTAGSATWRLPLADLSAAALAEALLAAPARRLELLREALARDAALALWAVIRCDRMNGGQLATVSAIAEWLAGRSLEALDWSPDAANDLPQPDAAAERHWVELTARSVAAAVGAAELAAADSDVDPQRAHLLGLLHAAGEWLASACPAGERDVANCVPASLADQLDRLEKIAIEDPTQDPVVRVVAEAVRVLNDRRRKARSRDFDPDRLRALGDRAARDWIRPVPGAGRCLPALIQHLVQVDRLTNDFTGELERQKIEALKEFAYGAGHEINNPLANIATRAQTLLRGETDPERRRALSTINSQVFRAHEMITDVMLFARPPQLSCEPIDVMEVVDTVVDELKPQANEQGTELKRIGGDDAVTVWADKNQLASALKALCANALEALGHGGSVQVNITQKPGVAASDVQVVVRDTGPGIPADVREHIFDPFFSGREAGRGLGFGLSKCWRIVTDHGGRIDVASQPGQGATFIITLPSERRDNAAGETKTSAS